MVYAICLAYAYHKVAKLFCRKFNNVDGLVLNIKKVFLKSLSRLDIFKTEVYYISLPPVPITTRWVMWLESAFYYFYNFASIQNLLSKLNPDYAILIEKSIIILVELRLKFNIYLVRL